MFVELSCEMLWLNLASFLYLMTSFEGRQSKLTEAENQGKPATQTAHVMLVLSEDKPRNFQSKNPDLHGHYC